jgi:hypothetical protein
MPAADVLVLVALFVVLAGVAIWWLARVADSRRRRRAAERWERERAEAAERAQASARAARARAEAELQALLKRPDVVKVLSDGPPDDISQRVFRWLKERLGRKAKTTHAEVPVHRDPEQYWGFPEVWTIPAPRLHPAVRTSDPSPVLRVGWDGCSRLKLPIETYAEVQVDANRLLLTTFFGTWGEGDSVADLRVASAAEATHRYVLKVELADS